MPNIQLQFRRGTSTEWSNANTVLADGELAIETNTRNFKIGNGSTNWNTLDYGGIRGVTGTQGTQGVQGPLGPQGTNGTIGVNGSTGPTGTQGIDGFSGGLTLQMNYVTQTSSGDTVVSTFAGNSSGYLDGSGTNASFRLPKGVAVDSSGNVYISDYINNRIRKITSGGLVTTLAGNGTAAFADGLGTNASFNEPLGIAVDSSGNVYVGDALNRRIRKITPGGLVSTLAGSGAIGSADGLGTNATFNGPTSLVVDSLGNVYVADTSNNRIRKITPGGLVSTLAGSGSYTFGDGTGAGASFASPDGVGLDSSGNLYVADQGNNRIRKIAPDGVVSTLAGSGSASSSDGNGTNASFDGPRGLVVDSSGNVYIGQENHIIRKITSLGIVSTLAGSSQGSSDGIGTNATFNRPIGLGIDSTGNIYITDLGNNRVRKITVGVDPNIYSGLPITGTLLTNFNPALTSSTITIPASTTNAKVASFTVAASSLPLKTSVTGVWTLTLYATVGLSTSPASFYFEIVDGATTVATGTTVTSVNLSSPMQLYKSNLTIPARTYTTNLTLNIYVTTQASSSLIIGFNGSTISYVNTTIPSVGFTGSTGFTGSQGFQGTQGVQGPQGTNGSNGTQGVQGPLGPQGTQGPIGPGFTLSSTTAGNIVYANGTSNSLDTTANVSFNAANNRFDVTSALSIQEVQETVIAAVPTTPYTINWLSGAIHYLTSIPSNLTVNITNLPTTSNRNYVVSVYLVQGGTPYFVNVLQIAGSATTIKWSGGSAPTATASRVEIQTFSLYYSGAAWTALSQLSSFG